MKNNPDIHGGASEVRLPNIPQSVLTYMHNTKFNRRIQSGEQLNPLRENSDRPDRPNHQLEPPHTRW